VLFHS